MLSPHFHLSEFTNSPTAKARHINNSLSPDNPEHAKIINNLRILCQQVLEPLRQHLNAPIHITSGYRSPLLNRAVGGVPNSQHLLGQAADIHIPDLPTGRQWFAWMMDNLHFDQLIWEHSGPTYWIHVSFHQGHNRQQVIHNLTKPTTPPTSQ